ncbi:MAG TPA: transposase [Ilumatobacter sp.]|nr:transposase [Ilumatobacter sp.]
MARPIRFDPEDGWHHVMNRGAQRQRTFFSATDANRFLSLLGEGHESFGVEIHAFCLMTNHFHLLVRCPDGGLSDFMQLVGSRYTRFVNDRRGTDGALFRGRFHSILVDDSEYRSIVGRYIHRNPLDLGTATSPASYRWSSLRYYLTGAIAPPWLRTDALLAPHESRAGLGEFTLGENSPIPLPSTIRWAIDVAIRTSAPESEDDENEQVHLCRTVAAMLLTLAETDRPEMLPAIDSVLGYPNAAARRSAMYRARRRCTASPPILQIAAEAMRLAA